MSLGKKCLQNTKINIFLLNDVYIILRRKKKSSQTGRKLTVERLGVIYEDSLARGDWTVVNLFS